MKRTRKLVVAALGLASAWAVPAQVAGRQAASHFSDDRGTQQALANEVAGWVTERVTEDHFATGSQAFDQEWVFGSYMMAAMGLGQVALKHPELAPRYRPALEQALDELLTPRLRRFDTRAWGSDALSTLGSDQGHVAYLGYSALALGVHRKLYPDSRFSALHDRMVAALARRYRRSTSKVLATYPRQYFPVDNLAAIGAIGLHEQLTNSGRADFVDELVGSYRKRYLDSQSGLLIQRVDTAGTPVDAARGSGSALGAYLVSWASPALARDLHRAIHRELTRTPLGFGMVREYVNADGPGDIDSGPLLLGLSISATGFSLGSARLAGDFEHFERVYRTTHLFGAPRAGSDRSSFVGGGPLGNAIMLAMLSAPRSEVLL